MLANGFFFFELRDSIAREEKAMVLASENLTESKFDSLRSSLSS